jgi:amidase
MDEHMTVLHDLSALEQARAMRAREFSPVELTEHYLDRIDKLSETLGAFITVAPDRALGQAKQAERKILKEREFSPLFGVPMAIKDLNLTSGLTTTFGSRLFTQFQPEISDYVTSALEQAGMICLGKTNTPEFGLACYTEPDVAPPARTPWSQDRSAGGSSGGAAAAVAAGLMPIAHGNDAAGSIRIPASACGVFGIKPSRGRVSHGPIGGDVTGLACDGPIARRVADAAAMLDLMSVPMPGDPYWAPPLPAGQTFLRCATVPPGRLRIGRYRRPIDPDIEIDPACVEAYENVSAILDRLGHEITDIDCPFAPDIAPLFEVIWKASATMISTVTADYSALRPLSRWFIEGGLAISAFDYLNATDRLMMAARESIIATAEYDVVLTPTLAQLPAMVGSIRDDAEPALDFERQKRFSPFAAPYNITGQPAVNVPACWIAGIPVGVQFVGRPADERTLISLAAQVEAETNWPQHKPPCWEM